MCPGSNRRGSGEAAQLITSEIKKSIGVVCSKDSTGQPGPMGRLGSSAISVMVASNSLSEWEVSNPLVLACLTIRGFETQGLNLPGPTWWPRLGLEDRAGCSTGSHFSYLEVKKGHPLWTPALYHSTEGPEDGRKLGRESPWAAEPQTLSILHLVWHYRHKCHFLFVTRAVLALPRRFIHRTMSLSTQAIRA